MKIAISRVQFVLFLLIISFCLYISLGRANTIDIFHSKDMSLQQFQLNLWCGSHQDFQFNEIKEMNLNSVEKKRKPRVNKHLPKQENPSKLRFVPRKVKPKMNRRNGVNRYYTVFRQVIDR